MVALVQCTSLFTLQFGTLLVVNYDTEIFNYQSISTLVIAVIYMFILVPFFANVLKNLQVEV